MNNEWESRLNSSEWDKMISEKIYRKLYKQKVQKHLLASFLFFFSVFGIFFYSLEKYNEEERDSILFSTDSLVEDEWEEFSSSLE